MKKFIKSIAIVTAASSFLLASSAMAADQKIGVVNFQEIMGKIPQASAVMQSLEAEFKDEQAGLTALEKDIKYLQEKKKRDGSLMSAKEKEALDKEIGEKYKDYQTRGQAFQQKVNVRQQEEQSKIIALVRQAIDNIAAKGKFDLVLEQKSVVYNKPEHSITSQVVEQVSKLK
ncbi:MAG: OmpH family outer membrane protein [Alteromonadaceae bacterium]|nr:OmpH family outer membrane protein [Alteromonadaceae bacterium]